jgi:phage transcriptional activator, RinA family
MGILSRRMYKKIEWYLYNYYSIRRDIEKTKEDIIEAGCRDLTEWGGGISYHSDPTASKAIKLTRESILEKERWIKVINQVIKHYNETEKGKLLQKKYFDELGERHICQELHIERATYYRWREEIVIYTAMLALQEGLIKINNIA